ncbi:TraR/DksA C4-type zinc finger protein [Uruburuella testudinis]|uniref:TraR/DksA C4-type zinc finger protein n=1 Tax=Uruburuella testudinis TaxID=1282863 RepID=A0ABY4DUU3_9NEIS|nr:TraR/DksA C4-type zinc finger protein [Uruburuella testudinis]UOO82803.1 TraR/DksA C4-type zinc finger protein [Uruburuella testudinis]
MNDFADKAAEAEALFREEALSKHCLSESHLSYSHCEDCGELIPEARRLAVKGCTRCIVCQEYEEKGWP